MTPAAKQAASDGKGKSDPGEVLILPEVGRDVFAGKSSEFFGAPQWIVE
jgi:hypothetical protein